ncbi:MAG: hypothetical protein II937_00165 [Bacteroidales bacterium]|nr:hypothetical protein [Bacteroidales bacterium]
MKRFRFFIAILLAVSTMVVLPSCDVLLQGLTDSSSNTHNSNNTNNNSNNTNNSNGSKSSGTSTGSSTSKAKH